MLELLQPASGEELHPLYNQDAKPLSKALEGALVNEALESALVDEALEGAMVDEALVGALMKEALECAKYEPTLTEAFAARCVW